MEVKTTQTFTKNVTGAFGEAGQSWLKNLNKTLDLVCERWSLELKPPYQPMSYNYVTPAVTSDCESVVLKAGVPHKEFANEINALKHFDGQGMVKLLRSDSVAGLMLLERIEPGELILNFARDDQTTSIYVDLLSKLKRAEADSYKFPHITDWHKAFIRLRDKLNGGTGNFLKKLIDIAEGLFKELYNPESEMCVLHGDLHHWNILSSTREPWLSIDPKGIIGPPEYEVGAWLRNPYNTILNEPNLPELIDRRVSIISESLGYSRGVILGWSCYQVILSSLWSYEEKLKDWNAGLNLVSIFLEKI